MKQFILKNKIYLSAILMIFLVGLVGGKYTSSTAANRASMVYATTVKEKSTGEDVEFSIKRLSGDYYRVTNNKTGQSAVAKAQTIADNNSAVQLQTVEGDFTLHKEESKGLNPSTYVVEYVTTEESNYYYETTYEDSSSSYSTSNNIIETVVETFSGQDQASDITDEERVIIEEDKADVVSEETKETEETEETKETEGTKDSEATTDTETSADTEESSSSKKLGEFTQTVPSSDDVKNETEETSKSSDKASANPNLTPAYQVTGLYHEVAQRISNYIAYGQASDQAGLDQILASYSNESKMAQAAYESSQSSDFKYAETDLNKDGQNELLIGNSEKLYAIYYINNGNVELIAGDGSGNYSLNLYEDAIITYVTWENLATSTGQSFQIQSDGTLSQLHNEVLDLSASDGKSELEVSDKTRIDLATLSWMTLPNPTVEASSTKETDEKSSESDASSTDESSSSENAETSSTDQSDSVSSTSTATSIFPSEVIGTWTGSNSNQTIDWTFEEDGAVKVTYLNGGQELSSQVYSVEALSNNRYRFVDYDSSSAFGFMGFGGTTGPGHYIAYYYGFQIKDSGEIAQLLWFDSGEGDVAPAFNVDSDSVKEQEIATFTKK